MRSSHPPPRRAPFVRRCLVLLGGLAPALLAGCQEDQITRYPAPRPAPVQVEPRPPEAPKVRLLAAIVPRKDWTWFFKLAGPTAAVTEQEKAFEDFIRSLRLPDDPKQPVAWKVPEGWREEPGKGMRRATFRLGPADAPLELGVFAFEGLGGSVADNINRWRRLDLGLGPATADQLAKATRELKGEGATATLVDMSGPGGKKP